MEFPNIREELDGYMRVIKIAKRPNKEEFTKVLKLTGLGMLVMGLMGLVITVISMLVGL